MPELPEVETVRRGLALKIDGGRVTRWAQRRDDLRFPIPTGIGQALTNATIERLDRRGKFLLIDVSGGMSLLAHLGMSGRMVVEPGWPEPFDKHEHIRFGVAGEAGELAVRFYDARRFGFVDLLATADKQNHPFFKGMGPEPLSDAFTPAVLEVMLTGRRTPLKAALLDQRLIAGLGNIYVCEALFWAGLDPCRPAGTLDDGAIRALWAAIRWVLTEAIAAGGSSLRDYVQSSGELGYFKSQHAVYGRTGLACPGCDCDLVTSGGIQRLTQSGRSTFHCPQKQR
jgi:formamidopyrimidine-DNA glycosylase